MSGQRSVEEVQVTAMRIWLARSARVAGVERRTKEVVEDRLDDRQHVERVLLRLGVEQVERLQRERGERLVERELLL